MCSFLNALGMAEIRLLFRTGAGKVRQAIVERCGPLAGDSFYSRAPITVQHYPAHKKQGPGAQPPAETVNSKWEQAAEERAAGEPRLDAPPP